MGMFAHCINLFVNKEKYRLLGGSIRATWPLSDEFLRSMLLFHWPNWHNIADIKDADNTWADIMPTFLNGEHCPNFVKA